MRLAILKDVNIPEKEYDQVLDEVSALYKQSAGIDLDTFTEERHFDDLWTEVYYNNYRGVAKPLLRTFTMDLENRFGKRFDNLVVMPTAENWRPIEDSGIWGWNVVGSMRGYQVQQVRFDTNRQDLNGRIYNSVGTLYHEIMHSHDSFIYRMNGVRIEDWFSGDMWVKDWDDDVVHGGRDYGGHPHWQYIRHKENTEALERIQHQLRAAYDRRKEQFNNGTPMTDRISEGYRNSVMRLTEPFAIPCFRSSLEVN